MLQAGDPPPEEGSGGAGDAGRARRADRAKAAGSEGERLAAFDEAVAEVLARVEPVYHRADGWLEQIRAGLFELLRFCDERPETARELVVDSIAWGPEVLARRSQLLEELTDLLDRGREQIETAAVPPPETAAGLVGASLSWVQTRLVSERGSFMELAPSLMSMIVHPYRGPQAAKRELERSLTYTGVDAASREPVRPVVGTRERSY